MSWLKIKKIVIFKCHLLLFYTATNHLSIGLWCAMKSGRLEATNSVVGPRRSSKALPKAEVAPKNKSCHCLVVCCQSDPLQLSECWWNYCIWEASSANQSDAPKTATPAAATGQQKRPSSSLQQCMTVYPATNASKIRPPNFASSAIFTWLLTNWLPLLQASQQLFEGKMFSQPAGDRNCFPRVHQTRSMDFYTTLLSKPISHW